MPSEQNVTRKLRAIFSADVKGCRILMADAEDVCVSSSTDEQINNKLKLKFNYLGGHKVKNIKNPVRDYKILLASARLLFHDKFPLRGCHVSRPGQNASIVFWGEGRISRANTIASAEFSD